MLNKTILVALNKLKPDNLTEALNVKSLFDDILISSIFLCVNNTCYSHLHICVNYNHYLNNSTLNDVIDSYNLNDELESELRLLNNVVITFVDSTIEEFNIYSKFNNDKTLNFNINLVNLNNVLVTSDVLKIRSVK